MHFIDNQDLCLMKSAKLQRFSPTIAKPLFGTSKHNVELSIFDLAVSLDSLPNSRSADSTIYFFNERNLLLSDVVQRTYPSNGGF